ncbi:MAG: DNRLRE domain-containing protein, partial [Candidatus Thorarchaeota archaeon]
MTPPMFSLPTTPTVLSATEHQVSIETSDDAHLISGDPDTSYGLAPNLELYRDNITGDESAVFLKFDLSTLEAPDLILKATLYIYLNITLTGHTSTFIDIYTCNNHSWAETTITWNNAPWNNLTWFTSTMGYSWYNGRRVREPEVTDQLIHSLSEGESDLTIAILVNPAIEDDAQHYYSRNNNHPEAIAAHIDVQYTPEPGMTAIDTSQEYASGSLENDPLWFTWINTSGVQLLYIAAIYPEHNHYFPSFHLIGQHYIADDGVELFIGNMLLVLEVFDDENQNGILDADFNLGEFETVYYLDLNISDVFTPTPVRKFIINDIPHYNWSLRYENVWGFLKFPAGRDPTYGDTAGVLWLEYLQTSYDYSLQGSTTYLKTSIEAGPITQIDSFWENITFTNLGLTALYSTILLASSWGSRVLIGDAEYDSHFAVGSTELTNATIAGQTHQYYSMIFNENYTLLTDPPIDYPATSTACPSTSFNPLVHEIQYREPFNVFRDFLINFLPQISSLTLLADFSYHDTDLLYRVHYPQWEGHPFRHDPLYKAYITDNPLIRPPPPDNIWWP